MSKLMVKDGDIWVPMEGLKGDTGPLPADESIPDTALVTDGAKTNTAYLMRNRLTKDAEGEVISVEDSYSSAALSLTVDGKSTQVQTTGKNLMPNDRSKWPMFRLSSVGSGTVVESGGQSHYYIAVPLEEGQSAHFHRNTQKYGGYAKYCSTYPPEVGARVFGGLTITNYADYTLTNDDGTKPCGLILATPNGVTEAELARMDPQLEYGTSFTGYEPYSGGFASPRPDWPQEIESIDAILSTTCAINFVPSDDPENPNANYSFNSGKRVVYDSEVGGFHLTDSGSGIAYTKHAAPSLILPSARAAFVAPRDGTYTFGVDIKNYSSDPDETNYGFRVTLNGTVLNGFGWGAPGTETEWTRHSITRTLSKGQYFGGNIYHPAAWRNISVVAGSEDLYEPYSGGTVSLLPEGTSLRSLPDGTKDELYLTYLKPSSRVGWAWYEPTLIQRVATQSCSGNENWKIYSNYAFYKAMPSARLMKTGKKELLCDAYKSDASASLGSARTAATSPNTIFGRNSETDAIIKTSVAYNTVNDFKAALAENPIVIQYPLATPITTTLDPIELPIMQAGITNLWSDPSTNLSVTYERDRNIVIANLKAAVTDLATS